MSRNWNPSRVKRAILGYEKKLQHVRFEVRTGKNRQSIQGTFIKTEKKNLKPVSWLDLSYLLVCKLDISDYYKHVGRLIKFTLCYLSAPCLSDGRVFSIGEFTFYTGKENCFFSRDIHWNTDKNFVEL